jgi:mannosylglycerate hydrolase MGH1-like protein
VLDRNRRGDWTCPAAGFYPHQWLWDSCFVAIGLARVDAPRAAGELRALFRGQWADGLLPHMVFAEGVRDLGSRRIWRSTTYPDAPRGVHTSCITQPPLPAIAAWEVAQGLGPEPRLAFLEELFPKLVRYHEWLYRDRDLRQTGLITLIHPWECGLDTTPPWMRELRRMRTPGWMRLVLRLRLTRLVGFLRRDTRFAPKAERASDADGLRMLVLADRASRSGFELRRLPADDSVQIEDIAFNAILASANRALAQIAGALGRELDETLAACARRTVDALEQLWDDDAGHYYSRNTQTGELLRMPTVATYLPLWSGIPRARVERLLEQLRRPNTWTRFPVPSVPTDGPQFDDDRYWKGPTWANTNWLVVRGLRDCGESALADELCARTLELVDRSGFAEYFSPLTGQGYGAHEFSWTAALTIDLLEPDGGARDSTV